MSDQEKQAFDFLHGLDQRDQSASPADPAEGSTESAPDTPAADEIPVGRLPEEEATPATDSDQLIEQTEAVVATTEQQIEASTEQLAGADATLAAADGVIQSSARPAEGEESDGIEVLEEGAPGEALPAEETLADDATGETAGEGSPDEETAEDDAAEDEAAEAEAAEDETAEEPPTDPEWIAGFAASLDATRAEVADLKTRWEEENPRLGDDESIPNALAALENEVAALVALAGGPGETVDEPKPFSFDQGGLDEVGGFKPSETSTSTKSARPRPQSGGVGSVLILLGSVVLGGLIAAPLAQLIIWWAIGKDPVKIAPMLPDALAFLAPANLRDKAPPTTQPEQPEQPAQPSQPAPGPPTTNPSEVGIPDFPAPGEKGPGGGIPGGGLDSGNPFSEAEPSGDPLANGPRTEPLFPGTDDAFPEPAPPAAPIRHRAVDVELVAGDQLGEHLGEVNGQLQLWQGTGTDPEILAETRKNLRVPLYTALCELARSVTYVNPETPPNHRGPTVSDRLQAARKILGQVAGDPVLAEMVGKYSWSLIRNPDNRPTTGIALAGTVVEIEQRGPYYEFKVRLDHVDEPIVLVVTDQEAASERFPMGTRLMLLGAMVDSPGEKIAGYPTGQDEVIWWGEAVKR